MADKGGDVLAVATKESCDGDEVAGKSDGKKAAAASSGRVRRERVDREHGRARCQRTTDDGIGAVASGGVGRSNNVEKNYEKKTRRSRQNSDRLRLGWRE